MSMVGGDDERLLRQIQSTLEPRQHLVCAQDFGEVLLRRPTVLMSGEIRADDVGDPQSRGRFKHERHSGLVGRAHLGSLSHEGAGPLLRLARAIDAAPGNVIAKKAGPDLRTRHPTGPAEGAHAPQQVVDGERPLLPIGRDPVNGGERAHRQGRATGP